MPFGLRSAPKVFNVVADAIDWIVKRHGVELLWHYLDDFITCGPAGTDECSFNLQMCKHLGVPLAEEKLEGPTTALDFLSILIDTVKGELRLPVEKLERLRSHKSRRGFRRIGAQRGSCYQLLVSFSMQLQWCGQEKFSFLI